MIKPIDATDARLLRELADDPRATVLSLAQRLGLARNTVQARLARLERDGTLRSVERRVDPAALGVGIQATVMVTLRQRVLDDVGAALAGIPEVLEVLGVSGGPDLQVAVGAADADDLYRVAGAILAIPGVERTETALVMRQMVPYRIRPLLDRIARSERIAP